MNIAGANLATTWTRDLGGFYGQEPYSQCPPGDPGYTKRCDLALGGDPFPSGCNINSCELAGCHRYRGNAVPRLCMHDPELHLRWPQQAALSHVFRTHCEACEIRPWMFPTGGPELMFRAYHLRAALMLYLYTAAWQSTQTGVLTMHPLYYDWPGLEGAFASSKFMFDDDPKTNPLNVAGSASAEFIRPRVHGGPRADSSDDRRCDGSHRGCTSIPGAGGGRQQLHAVQGAVVRLALHAQPTDRHARCACRAASRTTAP